MRVKVIGAGLAGCEAAHQLAKCGIDVTLCEMKPEKYSPAHSSEYFAELVCSNSLKAERVENACGLLKAEMRRFDSLMMRAAEVSRVPAGGALAVDRNIFAKYITDEILKNPKIRVEHGEVTKLDTDEYTVVATGPLTSDGLSAEIKRLCGDNLYFYDAAAPVVTRESIDTEKVFYAARYGRGTADYINCPFTEEEYNAFYDALVSAQTAELKSFEEQKVFEGCMPVEAMAKRGRQTLLFGPLKPVGLVNPRTGRDDAYAVVQLRCDDKAATLYNLVGFQTNLRFSEQKRVFSMIPALKNAEFVKYGVMHRNSFIDSPKVLNDDFSLRTNSDIYFAGQISGVEGYVESAMSGMIAGMSAAGRKIDFPRETMIGALTKYISGDSSGEFQPMNANFGILPPLPERIRDKKERYTALAERSLEILKKTIVEK